MSHETFDEMWLDAAAQIIQHGQELPSRDGPSHEILGYTGRLENPRACFMFNPIRRMTPSYPAGELIWYLSGERSIERIVAYAPQYTRFANEDSEGKLYAHGAYGHRFAEDFNGYTYIANIIRMLKLDPSTRQAVIALYRPDWDLAKSISGDKKDIPCTLSLNFITRANKLHLTVTMRSNDIWLGLPHDVFCFCGLQILIAECLGLELGWYQHQAMSLHVYDRNWEKFVEAANPPSFDTGPLELGSHHGVAGGSGEPKYLSQVISSAVNAEKFIRENKAAGLNYLDDAIGQSSLLTHVLLMCASKWSSDGSSLERLIARVPSKLLAKYMERFYKERIG